MSSPPPDFNSSGWWSQLGYLIGAGGLGVALLEVIKRIFSRVDKRDDDAISFRAELRAEITELNQRCDALSERLEAERALTHELRDRVTSLTAEALALRSRYHRYRGYLAEVVLLYDQYADRLNIPPHERLRLPPWLDEDIEGPTRGLATRIQAATPPEEPKR